MKLSGLMRLTGLGTHIGIALVASSITASCASAKTLVTAGERRSVQIDGLIRTYTQIVPEACLSQATKCAIVFGFHGGGIKGVSGAQFDKSTGMSTAAQKRGFILILPDARSTNWNDGRPEVGETADDVGFVKAIFAAIRREKLAYDPARVFATGMSNGGHMSFRLACEMDDTFSAIAPVSASLGIVTAKTCKPTRPISILNIYGTADPISPYKGGTIRFRKGPSRGEILSSDETLNFWVKANRCSSTSIDSTIDADLNDGTTVTVNRYTNCSGDKAVERRSIVGGGHIWPGEKQNRIIAMITGHETREVNGTETILDFFGL
jgi:polyhydroxybutyrate depolymerase